MLPFIHQTFRTKRINKDRGNTEGNTFFETTNKRLLPFLERRRNLRRDTNDEAIHAGSKTGWNHCVSELDSFPEPTESHLPWECASSLQSQDWSHTCSRGVVFGTPSLSSDTAKPAPRECFPFWATHQILLGEDTLRWCANRHSTRHRCCEMEPLHHKGLGARHWLDKLSHAGRNRRTVKSQSTLLYAEDASPDASSILSIA